MNRIEGFSVAFELVGILVVAPGSRPSWPPGLRCADRCGGSRAHRSGAGDPARIASARPAWLAGVVERLHEPSAELPGLGDLAEGASIPRIGQGRSLRRLGRHLRAPAAGSAAATLAGTDAPLARIAAEQGFVDQSHFTRAFKLHTGVTPARPPAAGPEGLSGSCTYVPADVHVPLHIPWSEARQVRAGAERLVCGLAAEEADQARTVRLRGSSFAVVEEHREPGIGSGLDGWIVADLEARRAWRGCRRRSCSRRRTNVNASPSTTWWYSNRCLAVRVGAGVERERPVHGGIVQWRCRSLRRHGSPTPSGSRAVA